MRLFSALCAGLLVLAIPHFTAHAAAPQLVSYQGSLTNSLGDPVSDGSYSVVFTVYDAAVAGSSVWSETQNVVTSGGLFAVLLGTANPILDSVFGATTRYLGVAVSGDPELSPRTALVSVPYAQRVSTVDGASGGTITSKVSIGSGHTNTGANAFVAGVNNIVGGDESTVCGGVNNTAAGDRATIGGGSFNNARGIYSVVAGGGGALAIDSNTATGDNSSIGGGRRNVASGVTSVVGGGWTNTAGNFDATVGGGFTNTASGGSSVVSGGQTNIASGLESTVGGGAHNIASGAESTVGGGALNTARGAFSVVAGGGSFITTDTNSALGEASTIPGGRSNIAAGDFSFAAGLRARANHTGTFVWADSSNTDFASTAQDQFLIRAGGGVGINKNDPQAPLDIKGVFGSGQEILRLSIERAWAFRQSSAGANTKLELKSLSAGATKHFLITTDGNVGISTTNPTQKLYVSGNICATGSIAACSDARYKKDVTTLSNSLSNVMQLRGVSYRWRQSEYPDHNFDGETHLGFIAQEIEKLYPEMVLTDADGYKSVDYGRLTPVLVEAIQDQQKQIDDQQKQIDELKSIVNNIVLNSQSDVTLSAK